MIAQTIKIFLIFLSFQASADMLYLTPEGQKELETTPVAKEGIVRLIDRQNKVFQWQPYRKNWEWDDDFVEVEIKWIALIDYELDTLEDIQNHQGFLDEYIKNGTFFPAPGKMNVGIITIHRKLIETIVKSELNQNEEADVGVVNAARNFFEANLKKYASFYRNRGNFPDPSTPKGRSEAFANQIQNDFVTGIALTKEKMDKVHFAIPPYDRKKQFTIDPRLYALKLFEYIEDVWVTYESKNGSYPLLLMADALLESSQKNLDPKFKAREQKIRARARELFERYFEIFPEEIEAQIQWRITLEAAFKPEERAIALEVFLKHGKSKNFEDVIDNLHYQLDYDLSDGFTPDPFTSNLMSLLINKKAAARSKLQSIVKRLADDLQYADASDRRWPKFNYLQSLLANPS